MIKSPFYTWAASLPKPSSQSCVLTPPLGLGDISGLHWAGLEDLPAGGDVVAWSHPLWWQHSSAPRSWERMEIKQFNLGRQQHFPSLGNAICEQLPLLTAGFWHSLSPGRGGCNLSLSFLPSKEGKTVGWQLLRVKTGIGNRALL